MSSSNSQRRGGGAGAKAVFDYAGALIGWDMTYEQFIEELRGLLQYGDALLRGGATHETQEFQRWWLEVRSAVELMTEGGYKLPGGFDTHLHFFAMWAGASPQEEAEAFNRDMQRTLIQIGHLVKQYEKYGEPARAGTPGKATAAAGAPASSSHTINIHGNVGAVQTGANSTAHVQLDATSLMRLTDAVEQLRTEISKGHTRLPAEEREQSLEVIDDLVTAARAPKPNRRKLAGLVQGLSDSIRTAGAMPGAWHAVKAAALHLLGLHL
jgi:hypothetical protein